MTTCMYKQMLVLYFQIKILLQLPLILTYGYNILETIRVTMVTHLVYTSAWFSLHKPQWGAYHYLIIRGVH